MKRVVVMRRRNELYDNERQREANRNISFSESNAVTGFTMKGMGILIILVVIGYFIKNIVS